MKKIVMIGMTLALISCQSSNTNGSAPVDSTMGSTEVTNSSGIDGVYYGGDNYSPGATSGYNPATNGDFYDNSAYGQNVVGGSQAPAKDRVIYFSFDSSKVDERSKAVIAAHATYLRSHPNVKALLEGHTDSRGSRGYNVALGERRAIAVLRLFNQLNVPANQLRIISYGEENPAVSGHSENAYKRNRRVVIQY
ncbi:MAG: peptidoglycan-associated lipoprotein [Gammaproteobacteria bacterium]|nr:MAG: peptidoglycan-associated lipoprotein [Gammaproteobacteria bacterium]